MSLQTKIIMILCLLVSLTSCSSTNNCTENSNYIIDYYSGGGFTGFEQGTTINCSGSVYFWNRKINSAREITDSLMITKEQIQLFNQLMKAQELFSYTHEYSGNYTSYLVLIKDGENNSVSFSPENLPDDMSSPFKELISEIKKLKNYEEQ